MKTLECSVRMVVSDDLSFEILLLIISVSYDTEINMYEEIELINTYNNFTLNSRSPNNFNYWNS